MGRDKKGEHFWVEARKKLSRKSQTSKNFDEEWRKNLAVTDMDSWYEQSSLLTLEQPSTKVLLLGFSESWTFHSLEFLLLAGIPNWTKLCHTQLQDSFPRITVLSKVSWDSVSVFLSAVYDQPEARCVNKTLEAKKKPIAFSASVSSLDESMKPFRIDLKFGPEASYDINFKKRVGLFRFSKLISRNTIRRNVYW